MTIAKQLQDIDMDQQDADTIENENFEVLDGLVVYAKNPVLTDGLTWAYYGGRWGGIVITAGTLTLVGTGSPSVTNYIVVNRSTGAISVSQASTNWDDTSTYARVYKVVAGASAVEDIEDHRVGQYGILGPVSSATVPASIPVACSDETTEVTAGLAKVTFRMPHAMTLTSVRASLTTATSGSPNVVFTVDINEGVSSILSTKLTIDHGEKTSTTAATPAVISDTALADDAEITIDVDVGGGGAKGLKVYLIGTRT